MTVITLRIESRTLDRRDEEYFLTKQLAYNLERVTEDNPSSWRHIFEIPRGGHDTRMEMAKVLSN
jgi:hypothetical protein